MGHVQQPKAVGATGKIRVTWPSRSGCWLSFAGVAIIVVVFAVPGTPAWSHECQSDSAIGVPNQTGGWVYDGGSQGGSLWTYDGDRLATPDGDDFSVEQFAAAVGAATGGYLDFGEKKSPWIELGNSYWSVDPYGALHPCPYCAGVGSPPGAPPFAGVTSDGEPPPHPPLAGIDPAGPPIVGNSVCYSQFLAPPSGCERLYYSTALPSNWVECTN